MTASGEVPVRAARDGALLRLELAAAERGNTIDPAFTAALAAGLADLDGVRCVVLTAEGRNFCLGGDIAGFHAAPDPAAYIDRLVGDLHASLVRLESAGVPVVVGVQGWAAGAGLSLVLAADVVVLERTTRLRTAYSAVGLSPDGGMSWTLPRAVGTARGMDMFLTNRAMDAAEAATAGLASRVVDEGTAADVAVGIAHEIASGPPRALVVTRDLVRAGRDTTFAAALDAERACIAAQAGSAEGREGVAAFLEGRRPRWT
jgi:2-(1,2-epoxy-1,2-dihydrophenyl)acetyl-CoA isomerase